ncbi:hypothetical protein INR38_09150 [Delftia sp. SD018]|uniref:hypothetical protein n=1 Tax=Delftia sp. SD018 TaxID=2781389 RepID=UPI001A95E115|nr:hypothetical protein [Delftia sp. SD018]MBO1034252.1 hypothetical protein [Delftia sp. SD018]
MQDPFAFIDGRHRHPTALTVYGDGLPPGTARLMADAYRLFCLRATTTIVDHIDEALVLGDGSKMRVVRNGPDDRIYIEPAEEEGGGIRIPHGFMVESPWSTPLIYRRETVEGGTQWVVDDAAVPQAENGIVQDNQAVIELEDEAVVLPMVPSGREFWDWFVHDSPVVGDATRALAINLSYPDEAGGNAAHVPHPCHVALGSQVVDEDGQVLYTVEPVLDNQGQSIGEMLPHASDARGVLLATNLYDKHLVSQTFDIYEVTMMAEHVERIKAEQYARKARTQRRFNPAINPGAVDVVNEIKNTLDRDADATVFVQQADFVSESSGVPGVYQKLEGSTSLQLVDQYGYDNAPKNGFGRWNISWVDIGVEPEKGEAARMVRILQVKGSPIVYPDLFALPEQGVGYAKLILDSSYPYQYMWAAGDLLCVAKNYQSNANLWRYGVVSNQLKVRAIERKQNVSNSAASIDLGWYAVPILAGAVSAEMGGRIEYVSKNIDATGWSVLSDNQDYYFSYASYPGRGYELPWYEFPDFPVGGTVAQYLDAFNAAASANAYPELVQIYNRILAETGEKVSVEELMRNDISYQYTTRYVIEHDYRAQFMAAICVSVEQQDNRWVQNEDAVRGQMRPVGEPSYSVRVFFEWRWRDAVGEKQLASAAFKRYPYECPMQRITNPFTWPAADPNKDINCLLPPQLGVTHELLDQLTNLSRHQGVSPYLAAQDAGFPAQMDSETGIEWSEMENGQEYPHNRMATGMLYARTLRLADFDSAFKLLKQLKIDCREGDRQIVEPGQEELYPRWFYCPELGEAVEKGVFHIELRDGQLVTWSDAIPTKDEDTVRPSPEDREITLRRV